jgi:hypothetical protein
MNETDPIDRWLCLMLPALVLTGLVWVLLKSI